MIGIKRFVPRTLFGRALLIIVIPVVLLQLFSAYIFFERHWNKVGGYLALDLANDIATVISLLEAFPEEGDQAFILWTARRYLSLEITFEDGDVLPEPPKSRFNILRPVLEANLRPQLWRPFTVDTESLYKKLLISVKLDGRLLHVVTSRKRVFSSTTYIFIMWTVGSSIVLLAIAIYFLRIQVRSVRRLAEAADRLGKGQQVPDFKPEGAIEVRQAAAAFIGMRDRIQRQSDERTEFLAGVSHDLRTPLTRMKLQLAMVEPGEGQEEDEGIASLTADVAEMEKMIDGYLDFARGEAGEDSTDVQLKDLLEDVVSDSRRKGGAIELATFDPVALSVRPNALKRCLINLIDNAVRHGEKAAVSVAFGDGTVDIRIDDDGPGIPHDRREDVFKAFFRLDASRNIETGGVGLGLTIAHDIARGHGGEILLDDAPGGGLRAVVRLPV
jgi:two-component system osmolarity sensor histidine kinase EnvZ